MGLLQLFSQQGKPAHRFEALVQPHVEGLFRFACRLCQNQDDAEELLQDLLSRLFMRLEEMEAVEALRPWLFRSLYNLYVDHYRKKQRHAAVFSDEEIDESFVAAGPGPERENELSQQQSLLMAAIDSLNDEQRAVILLHDAEGYTLVELADILQTPLGTLKSRLHRARARVMQLTENDLKTE